MRLLALSINHKLANLALREQVAFTPETIPVALHDALANSALSEVVILSTCNRTELLGLCSPGNEDSVLQWLTDYHRIARVELQNRYECHLEEAAIKHMIQVTSGLESMILGEPQIFGQMKSAFAVAKTAGSVGTELAHYFSHVFAVAKKVRSNTAIGKNPVSVAYAAVNLSRHIFSDLRNIHALLIGAGETIERVVKHLADSGVRHIVVANRTLSRARELARQFNAKSVLLSEIPEQLANADMVISSTASQLPILGKGAVEQALKRRKHRPILMIDLAVPRDIEVQIGQLNDIYLYTIDDLITIIDENKRHRHSEASKAQTIITEGVESYLQHVRSRSAISLLKTLRSQAESLRDAELQKVLKKLEKGMDAQDLLTQLARNLTNKLIHAPSIQIKKAGAQGRNDIVDCVEQLLTTDNR